MATVRAGAPCHRLAPTPPYPPPPGTLYDVQFVSPTVGWVVGANKLLLTVDGGAHWLPRALPGTPRWTQLDFIDARHGWVVAHDSLLATSDGGWHWRRLPHQCSPLRSAHFISPTVGFAVAGGADVSDSAPDQLTMGGVLQTTSDGGAHWLPLRAPADVQTVCFADRAHGLLGAHGHIYLTRDGGRHWHLSVAGPRPAQQSWPATAVVQCAGADAGWAVIEGPGGASSQQPHIGYHYDGSRWTPLYAEQYFPHPGIHVTVAAPGSYARAFSAIDGAKAVALDDCYACNTTPWALLTRGGAAMATHPTLAGLTDVTGASFLTQQLGWVVGSGAAQTGRGAGGITSEVLHTVDGGEHWLLQWSAPVK